MTLRGVSGEHIKPPAVAGMFYPDDRLQLQQDLDRYLAGVTAAPSRLPRALIVPHAGYVYSAQVAASAYGLLQGSDARIDRVLLLGPAHRVGFRGIAVHGADYFRTPLGDVRLDRQGEAQLRGLPFVHLLDQAFAQEHSLEVQLPFLQRLLPDFSLLPLLIGQSDYQQVAQVLNLFVTAPNTLILISSDLSHFHGYAEAQRMDEQANRAILALDGDALTHDHACGRIGIGGLLLIARQQGWTVEKLDLRNSGDTAGPKDRVVGYGAYAFF
jgi:AmmeMemoRadiSam system protein B